MENTSIERTVRKVIGDVMDHPDLDANTMDVNEDLFDYGLNSVSFIKIVVGIETEYDFEFEDEILVGEGFNTVGCFIDYVSTRVSEAIG
ncbi:phosphopantetheine-binding protein [Paenibacillus curdlanolyticus YK9]|uniref:Phosphopantetheine-binding protein n=1 Tax=Paenibacillus curdlanolyticus YK9 TaxID=717606 RepID=E0I7F2_9BACL|nr:phosphopantetheine-binding protein [Paenibacillus curdlanolyticus]EFM11968.1 phosphopantetheine-binding protein [Paenibacillus curdlanolyticus YK9]